MNLFNSYKLVTIMSEIFSRRLDLSLRSPTIPVFEARSLAKPTGGNRY